MDLDHVFLITNLANIECRYLSHNCSYVQKSRKQKLTCTGNVEGRRRPLDQKSEEYLCTGFSFLKKKKTDICNQENKINYPGGLTFFCLNIYTFVFYLRRRRHSSLTPIP